MRLTSRADECAYSWRFNVRTGLDAGGFHRHKPLKNGDLRPSDVRLDQGQLALETFPGVPISAKKCHSFFDVTLQARPRTSVQSACRPDYNSRNLGLRIGVANLKSTIGRVSVWGCPDLWIQGGS
jgi:hypothetical protein